MSDLTRTETSVKIRSRTSKVCPVDVVNQASGGELRCGVIRGAGELAANLGMNCIPPDLHETGLACHDEFLDARRKLMAAKLNESYRNR